MARCPYRALHLCHQDASKKEVDRGTQPPSLCLQTNIYEKFMVIRVKKKGLMVYFYRTGRIFTPDRQGTGKNQLSVEGVGAPIRKTSYNFCVFAHLFVPLCITIKPFNMSKKQNTDSTEQPRMVKSHDIHIDAEYAEWIAELKHRYRSGRTVDSRHHPGRTRQEYHHHRKRVLSVAQKLKKNV